MNKCLAALALVVVAQSVWAQTSQRAPVEITTPGGCNAAWPADAVSEMPSTVKLAVLVRETGKIADIKVVKSSKSRELDKASVAALGRCAIAPAMVNGQLQERWVVLQYDWSPGQPAVLHE